MVTLIFFLNKHRCFQSVGLLKVLSVGWQVALQFQCNTWMSQVCQSVHPGIGPVVKFWCILWATGTRMEVCGADSKTDNRWKHSCGLFIIIVGCKHFHSQSSPSVSISGRIRHFNWLPPGINLALMWLMGQLVRWHSSAGRHLVSQWMPEATSSTQSCLSRLVI